MTSPVATETRPSEELEPSPARQRWRPVLAVAGGLLVAVSLPPWGWWPLAFAGIALFDVSVGDVASRGRRARLGLAFAWPWMLLGTAWMWFLTVPGYLIASLLFAGLHAAAAAIGPTGPWRPIGAPAAHTLAEACRMLVPFGGVPLATLGIAVADSPLLFLARLGGVLLLTWLVFTVGIGCGEVFRSAVLGGPSPATTSSTPRWAAIGALVVVVALALVAPAGEEVDREPVTIAAVQGGGEQGTSALDVPSSAVTQAHLDATATIEPDDELDLVVWPENGIDVNRAAFADSEQFLAVAEEAERLGVPFAVGVTVDAAFSAHPRTTGFVNAQVIVTPDGEVTDSYEKVRIVPFGEYVPLRGPLEALGAPLDRVPADAVRGRDPAVITMPDGTPLGVMISWEVFFGDRGRAAADGEILLNPTNGASYTGTILQTQQVASSRLRAAETGRWVVQVSPTGFSAFVSPDGEVVQRTDVSEQRVIRMDVPPRTGTTWYTAFGDAPWILLAALAAGAGAWLSADRRRGVTPPATG